MLGHMPPRPEPKRIVLASLLWTVVGLCAWLMLMQAAMIAFATRREWRMPDWYQAQVVEVDRDPKNAFTCDVDVTVGGELDTITLPKAEAAELHSMETLWVLDNFCATPVRAAQYRLTPVRLLSEYPEVLLLLSLLGLHLLRRSRWGIPPEPPPVPESERKVYRDSFHERAQRHAAPAGKQ